MSPETSNHPPAESPPPAPSLLASVRLRPGAALRWIAAHRFAAILVVLAGLSVAGGLATFRIVSSAAPAPSGPDPVEQALEALDRGDYDRAGELAAELREEPRPSEIPGGRSYLLGVLAARDAEKAFGRDRRRLALLAARHLEESRVQGFPTQYGPQLLVLLGRSLIESGQLAPAQRILREALGAGSGEPAEVHLLLAAALLDDTPSKPAEALEHARLALADPALDARQRPRCSLQQAEILLRMGQLDVCRKTLDEIPPGEKGHAEATVLRARTLMAEARGMKGPTGLTPQAREKFAAACALLRQVEDGGLPADPAVRQAMYLTGVCHEELSDATKATDQFERTRSQYPGTAEGLAAALQLADRWRRTGRHKEAVEAYVRVLRDVEPAEQYVNPWVPLDPLRQRILDAYQHYLDARDYEVSLQMAQSFHPLFSLERKNQATAEVHRARGRDLAAQAERTAGAKGESLAREGRAELRRAGALFVELAKARFATRQYPEDLWEAATSCFEGRNFRQAAALFQEYLKHEVRRRQAEATVGLAESLLAMDRSDDALKALRACITLYPRDAVSFRARILAAEVLKEKEDLGEAERLLGENLDGQSLTPASREWRDSLFALGRLLHAAGRYDEAMRRLDEAARRYPDGPQALEARYLLADSLRQTAKQEIRKLEKDLVEEVRLTRMKRIRELLQQALDQYRQTREAFLKQQETRTLTDLEQAMLRNACFAGAALLSDLGQHEAAVKAWTVLVNGYQNVPEVLEAYLQMARAYRGLNKLQEARGTVEQAKVVLARLKAHPGFSETTNYTAAEWGEVLNRAQ